MCGSWTTKIPPFSPKPKQQFDIVHVLLVHFEGNVAVRGTVVGLLIPNGRLDVLAEFNPQKQRFVLS
jgi:hypothetical protein